MSHLILILLLCFLPQAVAQPSKIKFMEALNLVHVFSGAGDELERATKIAHQLGKTNPKSGMSETIQAELLSTQHTQNDGIEPQVYYKVLELTIIGDATPN